MDPTVPHILKGGAKRSHTVLSTVRATAVAVDQMFTFNNVTDAETVPDDGSEAEEPQRRVATVAACSKYNVTYF